MLNREIMIDGKFYTQHELTQIVMLIPDEQLITCVHSTNELIDEDEGIEGIDTYYQLPWRDAPEMAEVEAEVWALPNFDEYMNTAALLDSVIEILTDEQAIEVPQAFRNWIANASYEVGNRIRYIGKLYKCLIAHTSQAEQTPDITPSLWAEILGGQDGNIGEWSQPDSTNAYMAGDKVTHNGKTWESLVDNNVWEPGAVGTESLWREIQ